LQIIFCLHSDKDSGLNFVKTDKMDFTKDRFNISTEKEKMDIDLIHSFLTRSYWAEGISKEIIRRSIEGALCFGVFENDKQVGFARMITDYNTFGWLADVFVLPAYRGQGISKKIVSHILELPWSKRLRRKMLNTRDAQGLYRRYEFKELTNPSYILEVYQPDIHLR